MMLHRLRCLGSGISGCCSLFVRRRRRLRLIQLLLTLFLSSHNRVVVVLEVHGHETGDSSQFDPYQLNGGLVAAVAGRDYVVLATDTRMIGSTGYDILHRRHVSSRLWTAAACAATTTTTTTTAQRIGNGGDDHKKNMDSNNNALLVKQQQQQQQQAIIGSDGSLLLPDDDDTENDVGKRPARTMLTVTATSSARQHTSTGGIPNWMIASAGCSADCEALKRTMRAEMRMLQAHQYSSNNEQEEAVASMANLLSQVLYSRRGFPFYSFCVLAGLSVSQSQSSRSTSRRRGCVYAYDAIGSFEQVAVATAGTGRSLLQPILDGAFFPTAAVPAAAAVASSSSSSLQAQRRKRLVAAASSGAGAGDDAANAADASSSSTAGVTTSIRQHDDSSEHDILNLSLQHQHHVDSEEEQDDHDDENDENDSQPLVVDCSAEEACRMVLQAYRAVAEREIGVGDYVVLYCLQQKRKRRPKRRRPRSTDSNDDHNDDDNDDDDDDEGLQCQIQVAPLKMH